MREKITEIINKRKKMHLEDPRVSECWDELNEILTVNEDQTISYLFLCEEKELYWISEVFDDISMSFKSLKFIECLEKLKEKYPKLDIDEDIKYSKKYLEDD